MRALSPLLHRPPPLRAVAGVGETLRYEGTLDAALREWTIRVIARELSSVFEWGMHLPLAAPAGVPAPALAALGAGEPSPPDPRADLALARTVAGELLDRHRLGDDTFADATGPWGNRRSWS